MHYVPVNMLWYYLKARTGAIRQYLTLWIL